MFSSDVALIPAVIWAFSPIYYRVFMKRFDFLLLNLLRTSMASLVLLVPAIVIGFGSGVPYALLSGAITLACGDTLYLLSVRETGASVAAPVVYTYVLFVQLTATVVGEVVPVSNYVAAAMVIAGVFLLSRGGRGRPRAKGIALGLAAGLVWTAGQDLIQVATNAGGNVLVVTFSRNAAAAVALGCAVLVTRRTRLWPSGITRREIGFLAFIALTDLAVGSFLYVYSVSLVGIALTVILTSLSPFLTQLFSKLLGKESPTSTDFAGGAVIVAALILAVAR
ncbi:MAG: DMT family transporter [Nitrososphaerales archaeon]